MSTHNTVYVYLWRNKKKYPKTQELSQDTPNNSSGYTLFALSMSKYLV